MYHRLKMIDVWFVVSCFIKPWLLRCKFQTKL